MKKILPLLLLLSANICYGNTGAQIFADDFETIGLFAENWKAPAGIKPANGVLKIPGGTVTLRRDLKDQDFIFSADITPLPRNGEYQFVSVKIDGINFLLYRNSLNTAYRPASYKRSLGTSVRFRNYQFGTPCRLSISRQRTGNSRKYSVSINGENYLSFMDSEMIPTGKIEIMPYRAEAVIDNVAVNAITSGSDSPNLVINHSFEYLVDGTMPPYVNIATLRPLSWKTTYDRYLETLTVDKNEKKSGKNSLRLAHNDSSLMTGFLMSHIGVSVGKPVTGSIWLKSDKPGTKAKLVFWEVHHKMHEKPVTLTGNWERYTFTLPAPQRVQVQFGVSTQSKNLIWADDVQVELGEKATACKPGSLDEEKFAAAKPENKRRPDTVKVAKISKAPVIDGDLSDFPQKYPVTSFRIKAGKLPDNKTVASFACDGQYLYAAIRSYTADPGKIPQNKIPRDIGRVYAAESVELFFDPTASGKDYYQLAVNAGNSQADCGTGRNPAWNGNWKSAVKINHAENSIDYEFAFPLSDFADPMLSDVWGVNVGRNDLAANQISSLLNTDIEGNYHLPQEFAQLHFPSGITDRAKIGFANPMLFDNERGNALFEVIVRNNTGKALPRAKITLADSKSGKITASVTQDLNPGDNPVKITTALPNSQRNLSAVITLSDRSEEVLAVKPVLLNSIGPLQLFSRYSINITGKSAKITGKCNLPPGKYSGKAVINGRSFDFKADTPDLEFDLPLQNVAPGKYQIPVTVFAGNRIVASTSVGIKVVSGQEMKCVKIDHLNRTLEIDGKPALIVAPFLGIEPRFTPEMARMLFKTIRDAGFRYVTPGCVNPASPALHAFIKEAEKFDIKVVYWDFYAWRMRDKWSFDHVKKQLRNFKNIIAFLAVDEPELYAKSDDVKLFMQKHQQTMPEIPVFMNNTVIGIPGRFADLTSDILMIDDYITNREGRPVRDMLNSAKMVEKAGRNERKPAWFFPSGDSTHNHHRECTVSEQIGQCYAMLIGGCTGFVHFAGIPKYRSNWQAIQTVDREFRALEEAVFSPEYCGKSTASAKSLEFITRKKDGKLFIIAVNPDKKTVKSSFTLPGNFRCGNKAEVWFENRTIPVQNNVFQDTFKEYERHVYVIDLKK